MLCTSSVTVVSRLILRSDDALAIIAKTSLNKTAPRMLGCVCVCERQESVCVRESVCVFVYV